MGEEYQVDIPVWEGDGMAVDMTQGLGLGEQGQGLPYELIHTADDAEDDDEQQQQQQQQQQVIAISRGDIILLPGPSGQWELCCVISATGAADTASVCAPSSDTSNSMTGSNGCYRNSYTDGGTGTDIDSDMEDSNDGDYDDHGMLSSSTSSSSSSSSSSRVLIATGNAYPDRERGGKEGGIRNATGEGQRMVQEEGEGNDAKFVRIFDGVQERVVSMSATPTRPGPLLSFADLQLFLDVAGQGG